jgi:exopolysaccharide biosynthesis protein
VVVHQPCRRPNPMKHQSSRAVQWVFLLGVILLLGRSTVIAQDNYQPLASGLEYRHEVRSDGPLSIHSLRIAHRGHHWDIRTGLGQGTVFGLEPLDGIVGRTASVLRKSALAAINGDRFAIQPGPYQGDPEGIQIVDGQLVSRPTSNCFWVATDGTLHIGPVVSKLRVVWSDGKAETTIGLNEARTDDSAVLYTPILGITANEKPKQPPGTRTHGGKELVLERVEGKAWLPIVVGTTYVCRVGDIRNGGDTLLSPDQMILSIGPKKLSATPSLKPGDTVQLVIETEPDLGGVQTAIGVARILIQDGKIPDVGPANQPRHPRSMIGWNQQYLYFVVIDGRQPGISVGMTYPEMAALAREYKCTDAIELDGGGSSTLWAMGKVLNSPSDGKLRAIANGLILFRNDE